MDNRLKKVPRSRWDVAQRSEREFWEESDRKEFEGEIEKHRNKAKVLEEEWKKEGIIELKKDTKILQVGCGPEDVINYFSKGKKYAVDPLANFYKKKFGLNYKGTEFLEARGEDLPFEDNSFDIVLLTNVLDHVESPRKVLTEIKRVLKKGGIFYFEVFIYQKNFRKLAKFIGKIKEWVKKEIFNIHHPYLFLRGEVRELIKEYFDIDKEYLGKDIFDGLKDMEDLKNKMQTSEKFKDRFLASLGLYGYINHTIVCKKR